MHPLRNPGAHLDRDWPAYYDAVAGNPARDTLLKALEGFGPGVALDIGSGSGRDAHEMLRRGWTVIAMDGCPDAAARAVEGAQPADRARLRTVTGMLEDVDLSELAGGRVDLVNASFVLPFVAPRAFAEVWNGIERVVRDGGRFAGQLFGVRDSWMGMEGRTHHERREVEALMAGWVVEHLEEVEKDGNDAFGNPKHFHVFHFVLRRGGECSPRACSDGGCAQHS